MGVFRNIIGKLTNKNCNENATRGNERELAIEVTMEKLVMGFNQEAYKKVNAFDIKELNESEESYFKALKKITEGDRV